MLIGKLWKMKINIGSKNPIKIEAAREAFQNYFNDLEIKGIDVDSGVSAQPKTLDEITIGAKNRAINSFHNCKYSVGLEAGIYKVPNTLSGYCDSCCCMIYDGENVIGVGFSPAFEYPKQVIDKIFNEGMEVGEIFDNIIKESNNKQKSGAVGILSKRIFSRKEFIRASVIMALFPLINDELYHDK